MGQSDEQRGGGRSGATRRPDQAAERGQMRSPRHASTSTRNGVNDMARPPAAISVDSAAGMSGDADGALRE